MKTNSKGFAYVLVVIMLTTLLMAVSPAFANQSEDTEVEIEANPDTTTWLPDQKASSTTSTEKNPSIATDGSNNLWVAYENYNTSTLTYEIKVARSTDGGVSWTVMHTKTLSGYNLYRPSIAVDVYYDIVYVVYERMFSSTDYDIWLERYDYTGWYTEYVDNSGTNDHNPTIVCEYDQGSNNYVYIVWERLVTTSDIDLVFAKSTDKGDTWTQNVLYSTTNLAHQPSMAYADGVIYVSFRYGNSTFGDIYTGRSTNRSVSWATYNTDRSSSDCSHPSVTATHGGGVVMVAYVWPFSATDDDINYVYSTDHGSTYSTSHYSLAGSPYNERYPHLTVDGMGSTQNYIGYIHATYWREYSVGSRTNAVFYERANAGNPTTWSSLAQVADDNAQVSASYPSVADRAITTVHNSVPVIVWTDYRSDYDVYATTLGGKYTIDTYPSGLRVSIDGLYYDAPQTRYWPLKTTHSLATYNQASHTLIGWSTGQTTSTISFVAEQTSTEPIIAYFTPSLTLNLSPTPIARGSVLTISGQLIPGSATTVTLYYRTTGVTWAVATYLPTNAAGAYNVGATVPFSLPTGTYDLVAVWWDATTNRYAVSGIKQLIIT